MARVAGRGAVLECFRKALDANGHDNTLPPGSEGTPERAQNGLDVVGRAKQDKEAFRRLSRLSRAEYDRVRAAEAEALGIRIATLDRGVEALRPGGGMAPGQGQVLVLPEPDPWPEPVVDGAALLSELRNTIKKFLVCSPPKAAAIALWIAATWFEPAAQVAPILNIRSPLPRCGKTTLLDLIRRLSKRSLAASSITAAALFRTVEKCCPTLVIDEADSFFAENEEMRGVLNSGHTRQTAFVIRTVGEDHEPHQFSTWGFKAIAGIGKRAGTIEDRSIAIDLERKLRDERVSRLRHAPGGLFTTLQQKLCRWSSDNGPAIGDARPSLPEALNDRQQDNWEILVAIADLAGGAWPALVRSAAVSLSTAKDDTEPLGGQLLDDIKDIVNGSSASGLYSRELLDKLVTMPERPWGECNHGKPLTQNRLAKMLGAFGLRTKDLRLGGMVQRGYGISILKVAGSAGIKLSLNGDRLVLECAAKPPDSLIAAIEADKANIVAILKRCAASTAILDIDPAKIRPMHASDEEKQATKVAAANEHVRKSANRFWPHFRCRNSENRLRTVVVIQQDFNQINVIVHP